MKTIAIISQKGGVGKTTIAVHLAVEAETRSLTTVVFDLDPQGSAASWGDRRKQLSPFPAVEAAQASRLTTLLSMAEEQGADLAIIDSAPNADAASLSAARAADLILIPCRPATFDLHAIGTTLDLARVANRPAWVLLNAVPSQGKVGSEAVAILKEAGVQVADLMIHQLVAFSHAVNDGRTAGEYDPKCKAATEIKALCTWVVKQTGLKSNNQTRKRVGR